MTVKKGQVLNPKGMAPIPWDTLISRKRMSAELTAAVAKIVDFEELVTKLFKMAKDGNIMAAEFLCNRGIGKPHSTPADEGEPAPTQTINISLTDALKIAEAANASRQP